MTMMAGRARPDAERPPSRWRFAGLLLAAALLAFVAGVFVVHRVAAPPRHPLTGRQIAGLATDPAWMDRPSREAEEDPDRALDLVGIVPGSSVADVGAGSGYMTVRLAQRVGPAGRVYANELQPNLLAIIGQKAAALGLANVVLVQGTEEDARLPPGAIDLALLVDVYHEFRDPQAMLESLHRALKPGARLVLVEYRGEDGTLPIAPTHRMTVSVVRTEVEAEGYVFDRVDEGLPRQHVITFRAR